MIGWPAPVGPETKQFILAAAFGETVLLTGVPESGTEVGGRKRERKRASTSRVGRRPPTSPCPI